MDIFNKALKEHKKYKGKMEIVSRVPLDTKEDLSTYYSPGVAAVATHLAKFPEQTNLYTNTHNSVAIVSDGSAVLGLGNIGPEGALPVMEGKAILFKKFANIDGYPIVLNTQDPNEIINIVTAIAPSFGGINLEDISAPNCFYIEDQLKKRLSIPIMHDDQHGTAVVVLAGLINACKVTNRNLHDSKVVLIGAGAAGVAIAKLLYQYANPNIIAIDTKGVITKNRKNLSPEKLLLSSYSQDSTATDLKESLKGADIFIGVSKSNLLSKKMIQSMAKNPIIFALANPNPEITPTDAINAGAAVVATGRSDYPNQVNNVLAFPGLFRGALDTQSTINESHKLAAAEAIANIIKSPTKTQIIPSPFDKNVVKVVAAVYKK